MKNSIFILFLGILFNLNAQERFITRTGEVSFEASVPSFEPVAAINKTTTAILNTKNGNFAALVLVRGFHFENALMEEHFNENYAESFNYPKATLKATIEDFSIETISETPKGYQLHGNLTFHGVTRPIETKILLSKKNGGLFLSSEIELSPIDFKIEIPKILRYKVAKTVQVSIDMQLKRK